MAVVACHLPLSEGSVGILEEVWAQHSQAFIPLRMHAPLSTVSPQRRVQYHVLTCLCGSKDVLGMFGVRIMRHVLVPNSTLASGQEFGLRIGWRVSNAAL